MCFVSCPGERGCQRQRQQNGTESQRRGEAVREHVLAARSPWSCSMGNCGLSREEGHAMHWGMQVVRFALARVPGWAGVGRGCGWERIGRANAQQNVRTAVARYGNVRRGSRFTTTTSKGRVCRPGEQGCWQICCQNMARSQRTVHANARNRHAVVRVAKRRAKTHASYGTEMRVVACARSVVPSTYPQTSYLAA